MVLFANRQLIGFDTNGCMNLAKVTVKASVHRIDNALIPKTKECDAAVLFFSAFSIILHTHQSLTYKNW
jgi:hypothetical protein